MKDPIRLLLRLYVAPGPAMGGILDRCSLLFASCAALVVSALLPVSVAFYLPLLVLAVVYVPGILLIGTVAGGLRGGFGMVFRRDYAPALTCTAMAWAAANLPVVAGRWFLRTPLLPLAFGAAALYFLVLMFFAVRTVFGTGNGASAVVVSLSWLPLVVAAYLWGPLHFLFGWLASPFFLFYAIYYLGGEIGGLGSGLRSRRNFQRMLQAAAVNPHDAEAQYQLGLVYQQRHQYGEAQERFRRAVAIDPGETGAHFQLGRMAREQGRLEEALGHFQTVVDQDAAFAQSEILRELGALYLAAGRYAQAERELAAYAERRPYDPEGLYYLGQALAGVGEAGAAQEAYERAVEAVRTAPRYRQREVGRWSRLAQKEIRPKAPAPRGV